MGAESESDRSSRVWVVDAPAEVAAVRALFARVAREEGWQPDGALEADADRSVYFALSVVGELAGGLQLVLPDGKGRLPCHALWPEVPTDPARSAHVAVLALERPYRGRQALFWLLGVALWRYCLAEGIETLSLEVTPRVLPLYRRLGWPLTIHGDLREHWGEGCFLCALDVQGVAEAVAQKARRSRTYQRILILAGQPPPPSHPP